MKNNNWSLMKRLIWYRARHGGGGSSTVLKTITGVLPLTFEAVAKAIHRLVRYGKVEQSGTPTPSAPKDIVCNNGTVMMSPNLFRTTATSKTQAGVRYEVLSDGRVRCTGTATGFSSLMIGSAKVKPEYGVVRLSIDGTSGGTGNIVPNGAGVYDANGTQIYNFGLNTWTVNGTVDLSQYPDADTIRVEIKRNSNKETNATVAVSLTIGSAARSWAQYGVLITSGTPEAITIGEQIAHAENLYAVGDYKDEQDIISGAVIRKIGIKVLDGTESWIKGGASFYADGVINDAMPTATPSSCSCTHYVGIMSNTAGSQYQNTNSIRTYNATSAPGRINVFAVMNDYADGAAYAAFLASEYAKGTPVIVIYPLATPTTEHVSPQSLATFSGTNVVSTVANVSDVEAQVQYYDSAE